MTIYADITIHIENLFGCPISFNDIDFMIIATMSKKNVLTLDKARRQMLWTDCGITMTQSMASIKKLKKHGVFYSIGADKYIVNPWLFSACYDSLLDEIRRQFSKILTYDDTLRELEAQKVLDEAYEILHRASTEGSPNDN